MEHNLTFEAVLLDFSSIKHPQSTVFGSISETSGLIHVFRRILRWGTSIFFFKYQTSPAP